MGAFSVGVASLSLSARIRSFAVVGVDSEILGIGPVPATRKAPARA